MAFILYLLLKYSPIQNMTMNWLLEYYKHDAVLTRNERVQNAHDLAEKLYYTKQKPD
jgi:hypothetical protein